MIIVNRSTDKDNDSFWVAYKRDGGRCMQLYLGKDVNGAIAAAVAAGLPRKEAVGMAQAAINRTRVIDDIATPAPEPSHNGSSLR